MQKAWPFIALAMSLLPIGLNSNANAEDDDELVPDWIRNNAKWYAEGVISEDEFIQGIKFLLDRNIIFLDPEGAREVHDLREKVAKLEDALKQCLNRSTLSKSDISEDISRTKDCYTDQDGKTVCKICIEKDGKTDCRIEEYTLSDAQAEEITTRKTCYEDERGNTVCKVCSIKDGEIQKCWEESGTPKEDKSEGRYLEDDAFVSKECYTGKDGITVCTFCIENEEGEKKCWEERYSSTGGIEREETEDEEGFEEKRCYLDKSGKEICVCLVDGEEQYC